jgi:adenylosuccinate synthase
VKELASYERVRANRTERHIDALSEVADIVIDSHRNSPDDVLVRVASHLGLYGRAVDRFVDVMVGGQYGSEGKGHVASYLAGEYGFLVRVGGPNAGHTVYEEPHPYKFQQLPSGTRCSEAKLILGAGAVLSVPQLLKEIGECQVPATRLSIDPQAMIIEEEDRAFERCSLVTTIGSTGQGVGAATSRKILRDAGQPNVRLAKQIKELKPYIRDTRRVLESAFSDGSKVFVEGTQGTGLSLHHGDYPFVTSRETSVSGCLAEAGIAPSRVRKIILVVRTYPIRVQNPLGGTSGPIGKEISWKEIHRRSGIPWKELLKSERTTTTRRRRRVAEFDWCLLRKAASLNGPTDIALTFVDYVAVANRNARRFEQLTTDTIRFVEEIERVAAAPVSMITTRFHSRSIIDRRAW